MNKLRSPRGVLHVAIPASLSFCGGPHFCVKMVSILKRETFPNISFQGRYNLQTKIVPALMVGHGKEVEKIVGFSFAHCYLDQHFRFILQGIYRSATLVLQGLQMSIATQ